MSRKRKILAFFYRFLFGFTIVASMCGVAVASNYNPYQCSAGYGMNANTNQCELCPAGYYGPDDNNACSACPAGFYSRLGAGECTECPAGTYAEEEASSSCTKCPKGTASEATGATDSDTCVECPAGTYGPRKGLDICVNCPVGTYSSSVGAMTLATCLKCPVGTASAVEGATSSDTCEECENGFYASEEGSEVCTFCESQGGAAMFIPEDKSSCEPCPAGNCCYNFKGYVCNKGTYSTGGLACPESNIAWTNQSVCNAPVSSTGHSGDNNSSVAHQSTYRSGGGNRSEPVCLNMAIDMFPRKGVCTACPSGCTTETVGGMYSGDCTVKTINQFCANGGCFSWPTDGSISEQPISNSDIRLAGSCPR